MTTPMLPCAEWLHAHGWGAHVPFWQACADDPLNDVPRLVYAVLAVLTAGPLLGQLTHLSLPNNRFGPTHILVLLQYGAACWQQLDLQNTCLRAGWQAFAEVGPWPALTEWWAQFEWLECVDSSRQGHSVSKSYTFDLIWCK
jgi:hypothetical protein